MKINKIFTNLTFSEKTYNIIFLLIMYSGSTFLSKYVMELVCLLILIRIMQSGFFNIVFFYKKIQLIHIFLVIFNIFLFFQLFVSFDKNITFVFFQRFLIFLIFLLYPLKNRINYQILNLIKRYSIFIAISILGSSIIYKTKMGGLVGDYQSAGMMMSISYGIFLIDFYLEKKNKGKNIAGLFLCLLALFTSGKRMFTLIVLFFYLLIFYLINKKGKIKKIILLSSLMILGSILSYILIPQVRTVVERIIFYSGDKTYNGRGYYWIAALEIFKNNKLYGIGMGCFSSYFNFKFHRLGNLEAYDAHNIYIQMLAEGGVIGETLLIILLFYPTYKTYFLLKKKLLNKNDLRVCLFSFYILLWFILYGLTGNPLYGANQEFFYIVGVSMMLSVYKIVKERRKIENNLYLSENGIM